MSLQGRVVDRRSEASRPAPQQAHRLGGCRAGNPAPPPAGHRRRSRERPPAATMPSTAQMRQRCRAAACGAAPARQAGSGNDRSACAAQRMNQVWTAPIRAIVMRRAVALAERGERAVHSDRRREPVQWFAIRARHTQRQAGVGGTSRWPVAAAQFSFGRTPGRPGCAGCTAAARRVVGRYQAGLERVPVHIAKRPSPQRPVRRAAIGAAVQLAGAARRGGYTRGGGERAVARFAGDGAGDVEAGDQVARQPPRSQSGGYCPSVMIPPQALRHTARLERRRPKASVVASTPWPMRRCGVLDDRRRRGEVHKPSDPPAVPRRSRPSVAVPTSPRQAGGRSMKGGTKSKRASVVRGVR